MLATSHTIRSVAPRLDLVDGFVSDARAIGRTAVEGARTVLWLLGEPPARTSYRQVAAQHDQEARETQTPVRLHPVRTASPKSITPAKTTGAAGRMARGTPLFTPGPLLSPSPSSSSSSSAAAYSAFHATDSKGSTATSDSARGAAGAARSTKPVASFTMGQRHALTALHNHLAKAGAQTPFVPKKLERPGDRACADVSMDLAYGVKGTDGPAIRRFLSEVVDKAAEKLQSRPRRCLGLLPPAAPTQAQRRQALIEAMRDVPLDRTKRSVEEGLDNLFSDSGRRFLHEVGRKTSDWGRAQGLGIAGEGLGQRLVQDVVLRGTFPLVLSEIRSASGTNPQKMRLCEDLEKVCQDLVPAPLPAGATRSPGALDYLQKGFFAFAKDVVERRPKD